MENQMKLTLGEKIQYNRKQRNMSQEKVAELVGVSRQAVTKWETDKSAPSTDNLIRLSEIFEITLDEMLRDRIYNVQSDIVQKSEEVKTKKKLTKKQKIGWIAGSVAVVFLILGIFGVLTPLGNENMDSTSSVAVTLLYLVFLFIYLGIIGAVIYFVVLLAKALNKYIHS